MESFSGELGKIEGKLVGRELDLETALRQSCLPSCQGAMNGSNFIDQRMVTREGRNVNVEVDAGE